MPLRQTAAAAVLAVVILATGQLHALTYAGHADNIAYVPVHQMGYVGTGTIVGVIDAGYARSDHRTFYTSDNDPTTRVTRLGFYGGAGTYTGHANAVAGIAAGRGQGDGSYLGVAPGAEVWSASTSGEDNDTRQAYLDFTTPDRNGRKCEIFVMSLGFNIADNGSLYSASFFFDWLATDRGALISFPSGNNPAWVGWPGGTYNHLTVGGVTQNMGGVSATSGRGPTPDGRSKPDVVAPASRLHLPDHVGTDAWYQNPGSFTSVAAPFGAGTAALLRQYSDDYAYAWDPRIAKVCIMNSATKLPGWSHTDTQPLDTEQGAGRISVGWALHQYAAGEQGPGDVDGRGWDREIVTGAVERLYHITDTAREGSYIAATLTWYRHTSASDDNLLGYSWTVDKFENLDLYLYRESDCSLVAQSISIVDSVEHIFFEVDQTDNYALAVALQGVPQDWETYALAWFTLIPGDADGDGKVDGSDLATWQRNYDPLGLEYTTWTMGDWNMDNRIDGADLALWQQNYDPLGTGRSEFDGFRSLPFTLTPIPEPSTLTLAALALGALRLARRRRQSTR